MKMDKILLYGVLVFMLVASLSLISAVPPACNGNPGSIWTTNGDCGNVSQDVNQYNVGDKVFINGEGFCANTYDWAITGKPGGASSDPGIDVANGSKVVDSNGSFCFEAYTVQLGDEGEYGVKFNGKGDNYRIQKNIPVVPEFGMIAGLATILGSVGLFFFIRKK